MKNRKDRKRPAAKERSINKKSATQETLQITPSAPCSVSYACASALVGVHLSSTCSLKNAVKTVNKTAKAA
jgi:hypothetical protein